VTLRIGFADFLVAEMHTTRCSLGGPSEVHAVATAGRPKRVTPTDP